MSGWRQEASSVPEKPKFTLLYHLETCAGGELFSVETPGFGRLQMLMVDVKANFAAAALIYTHNQTYHTGAGSNVRCVPRYECTSTR